MPFDTQNAEALRAAFRRAESTLRVAQIAVLAGLRSQTPVGVTQALNNSLREASVAASAAAAAYHLYLLDNAERAQVAAKTIADGIGYVGL